MADCVCDMKGFLSFLILWSLRKEPMTGAALAAEFTKRKGTKPSPGTIYPALKDLKEKGLIQANSKKVYTLTARGKKELDKSLKVFTTMFADFHDMQSCCR